MAVSPPLQAAGRAVAIQNSGKISVPSAPGPLALTPNSLTNLSISAPSLNGAALPSLTLAAPQETLASPVAIAAPLAAKQAVPKQLPRQSGAAANKKTFKKQVAVIEKRWGALKESDAEIQESGSASDAHGHGTEVEAFLTGALPVAASLETPLPDALHAKSRRTGLQPAQTRSAEDAPTVFVAEPTIAPDQTGNPYRPDHPFAGFFKLLRLEEAPRPGFLGATLAAAILGVIPGLGAIALHEYGHYFLARATGAGAASMRMYIPRNKRVIDENGYSVLGFVKIGPPKTPLRNYILSAAGPAFSAVSFMGLALGIPAAAVAAALYGYYPNEMLAYLTVAAAAVWSLVYWGMGKDWAFHGGTSDREHMDAARSEMFQFSSQAVRIGPLLGPALAHLQVETGDSAQEVLKRALELLDEYHGAADRFGWVTLEAGGQRFRFPLQSGKASEQASAGYRPIPAAAIPSGEHWHQGEPDIVTVPLDAAERARLRRHKRRLRYPWNSWVFFGALHLYASVLETERRHGPVTLIR